MRRRTYLGLAAGAFAGLAGCTVRARRGPEVADDPSPAGDCPALLDAERSICPDDDGGPLSVARSPVTVSGVAWTLEVAVTNRAAEPYGCDPFAWSVFRKARGSWTPVVPGVHVEPWVALAPGDRHAWQLSATAADPGDPDHRGFLALDPGAYAFAIPFRGPARVAAVAPFAVDA